jgi:hypothetical protein
MTISSNVKKQKKNMESKDLDDLLEDWTVLGPTQWKNNEGPNGWWAVTDDAGIVAYFQYESDAFRFRLSEINRILNK